MMPRPVFYGVLALCLSGAAAEHVRADQRGEDALLNAARASSEALDLPGAESEIERRAIAAAPGFARREGNRLIFGEKGFEHVWPDAPACKGPGQLPCGRFKLIAYLESRRLLLIQHTSYAGTRYVLIDYYGGTENIFFEVPHVSPTGEYVVARGEPLVTLPDHKLNPNPHIELWRRTGLPGANMYFVMDFEASPHYPEKGLPAYKFDRWVTEKYPPVDGDVLFEAHLEIDGKTRARFHARYSASKGYEMVEAP